MKVRISISRKKKDSDEYEQEFSGFCTFIGTAKAKAEKLKIKDRIKLGDVDVTTWYDKEKKVEYVTYKVFDFELFSNTEQSNTSKSTNKTSALEDDVEDGDVDEENIPF